MPVARIASIQITFCFKRFREIQRHIISTICDFSRSSSKDMTEWPFQFQNTCVFVRLINADCIHYNNTFDTDFADIHCQRKSLFYLLIQNESFSCWYQQKLKAFVVKGFNLKLVIVGAFFLMALIFSPFLLSLST